MGDGSPNWEGRAAYCAGGMRPAAWCLLAVYAGGLFLWQLGSARTFTGHESYPVQGAREMLATGDWLVPRIAGQPWLEKPPLTHWAIALFGSLAGEVNEVIARLPSSIAGLLGVLLVASLAARWFGPVQGLLAGLAQATTIYTVTYARLAEADIYLWLLVLTCWWLFARGFVAPLSETRNPNLEIRNPKQQLPQNLVPKDLVPKLLFGNETPRNSVSSETEFRGGVFPNRSLGTSLHRSLHGLQGVVSGLRASCFGFVSDFVFRISDFVRKSWLPVAFFLALGATQLTKGPLFGLVIALAPCVVFVLWTLRPGSHTPATGRTALRWLACWPGLVLGLLVATAWPLGILLRYPDTADLWWTHTFGRLSNHTINPKAFYYYLTTLPWQVLPWTAIAVIALPASWRRAWREGSRPDRFLWAWVLSLLALLSMVRAKHHHYLIYALPPFSIWTAESLLCLWDIALRFRPRPRLAWSLLLLGIGGWLGAYLWAASHKPAYSSDVSVLGGLVVAGGVAVGVCCAGRWPWATRAAAFSLFATVWCVYAWVHSSIFPKRDAYRAETAYWMSLDEWDREVSDGPLLLFGVDPARPLLYLRTPIEVFTNPHELRRRALETNQQRVVSCAAQEHCLREVGRIQVLTEVQPGRRGPPAHYKLYHVDWMPTHAATELQLDRHALGR